MKCPKCGYLGFEPVERCRNCGYEFSLTAGSAVPDLSLRSAGSDQVQPLADLALVDDAAASTTENAPPSDVYATPKSSVLNEPELTLFGTPPDDAPMITRASAPRTPLSVRRATPEVPRLRSDPRTPAIELSLPGLEAPSPHPVARTAAPAPIDGRPTSIVLNAESEAASAPLRAGAAIIDLLLLAAIDVLVVYLTMKICGLAPNELALLPILPLGAFLLAQNLGYFIAFTAGGQTLGKMTTGIRVVVDDGERPPDLAHALRRVLMWTALTVPAGLGLLTVLFTADGRGLHDHVAGTRVIRS